MSRWITTPLADVVTLQRGHDLPANTRGDGTVPVIGSFGITGYHDVAKYIGPGVAIGRSGASIGVATYCPEDFWPLNTCLFVTDFRGNDPRWVYYLLDSIDFSSYNSGSAQPSLNRNYLANIQIQLPPVEQQRAIAATLGALDDKIESNRRASDLLDQLARVTFREWRATVGVEQTVSFGAYADVFGGATPKTTVSEYWDGHLAWATPTDLTALSAPYLFDTGRKITEPGLASCTAVLHPPGTILMTSRATIGAFAINQVPTATNQGFIAVRPRRDEDRWFLFEEMRSRVAEFIDNANGSTFLEISRGRFKELPLSVPATSAIDELADRLDPVHSKAAQLSAEAQRLAALRDALLPELLSGRIRVPEAAAVVQDGTE